MSCKMILYCVLIVGFQFVGSTPFSKEADRQIRPATNHWQRKQSNHERSRNYDTADPQTQNAHHLVTKSPNRFENENEYVNHGGIRQREDYGLQNHNIPIYQSQPINNNNPDYHAVPSDRHRNGYPLLDNVHTIKTTHRPIDAENIGYNHQNRPRKGQFQSLTAARERDIANPEILLLPLEEESYPGLENSKVQDIPRYNHRRPSNGNIPFNPPLKPTYQKHDFRHFQHAESNSRSQSGAVVYENHDEAPVIKHKRADFERQRDLGNPSPHSEPGYVPHVNHYQPIIPNTLKKEGNYYNKGDRRSLQNYPEYISPQRDRFSDVSTSEIDSSKNSKFLEYPASGPGPSYQGTSMNIFVQNPSTSKYNYNADPADETIDIAENNKYSTSSSIADLPRQSYQDLFKHISITPKHDNMNSYYENPNLKHVIIPQGHRFMVIHTNGTIEYIDQIEPILERSHHSEKTEDDFVLFEEDRGRNNYNTPSQSRGQSLEKQTSSDNQNKGYSSANGDDNTDYNRNKEITNYPSDNSYNNAPTKDYDYRSKDSLYSSDDKDKPYKSTSPPTSTTSKSFISSTTESNQSLKEKELEEYLDSISNNKEDDTSSSDKRHNPRQSHNTSTPRAHTSPNSRAKNTPPTSTTESNQRLKEKELEEYLDSVSNDKKKDISSGEQRHNSHRQSYKTSTPRAHTSPNSREEDRSVQEFLESLSEKPISKQKPTKSTTMVDSNTTPVPVTTTPSTKSSIVTSTSRATPAEEIITISPIERATEDIVNNNYHQYKNPTKSHPHRYDNEDFHDIVDELIKKGAKRSDDTELSSKDISNKHSESITNSPRNTPADEIITISPIETVTEGSLDTTTKSHTDIYDKGNYDDNGDELSKNGAKKVEDSKQSSKDNKKKHNKSTTDDYLASSDDLGDFGDNSTSATRSTKQSDMNTDESILLSDIKLSLDVPNDSDGTLKITVNTPDSAGNDDKSSNGTLHIHIDTTDYKDKKHNTTVVDNKKCEKDTKDQNSLSDLLNNVVLNKNSDKDFINQLPSDNSTINLWYLIQMPRRSHQRVEKNTKTTIYPNGTVVEEFMETKWQDEDDSEPNVVKTTKISHKDHKKHN